MIDVNILDLIYNKDNAIIIPIIMAITQFFKTNVMLKNKFLPYVNIISGISLALLLYGFSVKNGIIGLMYGLTAAGVYRSIKVISGNDK
jgi:hypothetical protein